MPQHEKQAAARGNSKAEFCSCRAISSGATKGTCHASKSKMQALLGLGIQWRDKVGLSRKWCWRDRSLLPRHCVPKPSKDCIFDLVAWQIALVAPLRMARQSMFVAPPWMARQAQNFRPTNSAAVSVAAIAVSVVMVTMSWWNILPTEFPHTL